MEKKGFVCLAVLPILCLSLMYGCASGGRLRVQSGSDTKVFLKDIEKNEDKYIIHANEWPDGEVAAIVFDPKDDNRTIENDGWTQVTSQEQLSKLIARSDRLIFRQFFKILGPSDDLYGYLLGGERYVWIVVVDESSLKLHSTRWSPAKNSRYDPFQF